MLTIVVNLAISVNISLADHLIDFTIGQFLPYYEGSANGGENETEEAPTEVSHNMPQLGRADVSIPILIKYLERLLDLLLTICVPHLPSHHGQELGEIDCAVPVGVDFVDHILKLCFCWILAQGTHDRSEFFGCDCAIAI